MPHMVVFRSPEGKPGYHQTENLDDAVRFVERLRNQEQVNDARIFLMQEIPIEFKTYYRVEVGGDPAREREAEPAPAEGADAVAAHPPGRLGRFVKS